MLVRGAITIYHNNGLDVETRLGIVWKRHNYSKVWYFEKQGANISDGYTDANTIKIRIPYKENDDLDVSNFAKGDIIVVGALDIDIQAQEDLKGYTIYNIDSIDNNNIGLRPHIYIGGK